MPLFPRPTIPPPRRRPPPRPLPFYLSPFPSRSHSPLAHLINLLTTLPVLILINTHVASLTPVSGRSMWPLLNGDGDGDGDARGSGSGASRDVVLVARWRPMSGVRRGMLVAFWSPTHPEIMSVKRVLALENDVVRTKPPYPKPTETVPRAHIWVEGDHPEGERWSLDSNHYGPISKSLLVGQVRARVFPFGRMGWLRWQDWKGSERVREGNSKDAYDF